MKNENIKDYIIYVLTAIITTFVGIVGGVAISNMITKSYMEYDAQWYISTCETDGYVCHVEFIVEHGVVVGYEVVEEQE